MREVQVTTLPNCDFCEREQVAEYDAQTTTGSWANMCPECFKRHGKGWINNRRGRLLGTLGTKRVLKVIQKSDTPGKAVQGTEDDSFEYMQAVVMSDEHRTITCPECGMERHVEPDASYTYKCECGVQVQVPDFALF